MTGGLPLAGVDFYAELELNLREDGYAIGGDQLKTSPRGYERDHPRADLLRHRSLTASRHHGTPDWLDTPEVVDCVVDDWRAYRPLMEWLRDHVA